MTTRPQPAVKPARPFFSSGPCAKRPGWSPQIFEHAVLGRSHRSSLGKARLKEAIDKTRQLLEVPKDYLIGIVPASDTGAMEMAMWSLLGPKPVTLLAWESFGKGWVTDVTKQLKLEPSVLEADYGDIPNLTSVDQSHDVIFTWNGTTSGVRVPNANWISDEREGLTICDATSAAFAQELDWRKLDATTFSWQKVMGSEAAHGVVVLSPRAVERLENYTPPWPMPKIFRLTKNGKLIKSIFEGATINTPSMLCVEDYVDSLKWGLRLGGNAALLARADANLAVISKWVAQTDWVAFLCDDPTLCSNTSLTLKITDARVSSLPAAEQRAFVKKLEAILADAQVAFDIGGYRDAPPGLRIWGGATVEASDLEALTPWLDYAFELALQH